MDSIGALVIVLQLTLMLASIWVFFSPFSFDHGNLKANQATIIFSFFLLIFFYKASFKLAPIFLIPNILQYLIYSNNIGLCEKIAKE